MQQAPEEGSQSLGLGSLAVIPCPPTIYLFNDIICLAKIIGIPFSGDEHYAQNLYQL
jgi:hypothetical protein